MRVTLIGGTRFVGPAAIGHLLQAGHEVCVAHSGEHEAAGSESVEHLHGERSTLLGPGGLIDQWAPEILVDTFWGGATAEKADQLTECAARIGAQMVAVSSMDVYQHCVDAGVADGSGMLTLAIDAVPLVEDSRRRTEPYPGGGPHHDNVAMEDAISATDADAVVLRPGTIYGPVPWTREWTLVREIALGNHQLPLPDGGTQLFHRVAVERVGRAIAAATHAQPRGLWACNVVDPADWDYSGLARHIADILGWKWEPHKAQFDETDHPWQVYHPVLGSDRRLRDVLDVSPEHPSPEEALRETVGWLWDHRYQILETEPGNG